MKTPKFQPMVRAAALAIALAGTLTAGALSAGPALAEPGTDAQAPADSTPTPTPVSTPVAAPASPIPAAPLPTTAPAVAPEISDAGLAEAVQRDLGMTLEEFNAAGQLARRAADAAPSLRTLPGYLGIRLQDDKILVEGNGAELQARVNELNGTGTAAPFVLAASPPESSAAPTTAPSAAPAADPSAAELVASSTEQLFQAYVREVGPAGLQAVAYSGGRFVIRTGGTNVAEAGLSQTPDPQTAPATTDAAPGKISPADFVSRYANVQLEQGPPVTTEADLYGGEGYIIDAPPWRTICSTGFGAYSPAGLPVVLTAGHCAEDGTAAVIGLEPPTASLAGGSLPLPGRLAPLGSFGFSQFGGRSNSTVLNPRWNTGDPGGPGNVGTDIAVIEALNGGLNVQAAATTWANAANPGATAVKIIGTVAPFQGQEVCRSGRTTGWSCGQVDETGIYVVGGRTTAAEDLRAFRGFLSKNVQSSGGDSGGPWISGNFAVGIHSAGEPRPEPGKPPLPNFAVATTLQDALGRVPGGVQLQLFLTKPTLATAATGTVTAGEPITGHVSAGPASMVAPKSKVRITVGAQKLEVPVDAAGNWQFPAPSSAGQFKFSAETVNGFSRSGAVFLSVVVSAPVSTGTPAQPSGIAAWAPGTPARQPAARQPGVPARQPAAEPPGIPAPQPAAQPQGTPTPQPAAQPQGTPAHPVSPAQTSSPAQVHVPPSDASVTVSGARPDGTSSGNAGQLAGSLAGLLPAAGLGAGALLLGAAFVAFGRRRKSR
ncbi:Trypsin [Arthrobacter sp. ov407]|uniref:S1 family peptidase n=1 Tax=Arthrobacter sp. ov407 TaxID=1761748 RepID=UPI000887E927|nr:S1 family peptidase [Arthrobacter sp. ov407]SDK43860.1 Trypsin [Arthrobacter sp. ov407]